MDWFVKKIGGQTSRFWHQTTKLSYTLHHLLPFDSLIMVRSKLNQIHGSQTSKKCQEACQQTIKKFYFPKQTAVLRTDFQYATYLIRKITEREEVKVFFPLTTKWTFKSLIWNTYRRKYWKSSRPRSFYLFLYPSLENSTK